ncbi:MAG TPA: NADH-quinone oxidoreductase subunit NuoE [Actinoplanes sp.]
MQVEFSPAAAPLAEKLLEPARAIIARYPVGRERSALLPLLHLVQTQEGFVSPNGVAFCAEVLGINKAQVGAVATFYTMYKRRPTGEYLVSVCTNTLCNVMGGQEVYDSLSEHLGVGHDETTDDGRITLEHAECLAACDYAPVVTVNYDFAIDQATPDAAVTLVEQLRAGERPALSRGARICSLREMSMQLAGFPDPRTEALADGPAGPPSLRGATLAQEHGIAVAGFDPETPLPKTKPSPREENKPGPVTTAARKAAKAVKSAAGAVAEAVEHRRDHAGKTTDTGDVKDPEVRTAEVRNPTGDTPGKPVAEGAVSEGVAGSEPAGDAKPAGDAGRGSIVDDNVTTERSDAGQANPGWTNVPPDEEKK